MSDIIFVQTRHWYGSMQDYFHLAELAGYPVIFDDEMQLDNADHCYILTWFSAQEDRFAGAKARVICWNLEWAADPILPGVEYWSPDAWYAAQHDMKYVPVGSDKRLLCDDYGSYTYIYDIALMMYRDPNRRRAEIQRIDEAGFSVAPDGWGGERHRSLAQSRCLVHIHQLEGINTVSSLRFALAAAYYMPILSERLERPGIFATNVIQAEYGYIALALKSWLNPTRDSELRQYGRALHQLLCVDHTFRHAVESNV